MGLTSTMFTGLSGLDVNQTKLNVVGNNIANVNTTAFKSSRALFKPQFYVTDSAGGPAGPTYGGQNPSQRGLGATMAAIEKDLTTGSLETTGKDTDMAIDGEGYFIVGGGGDGGQQFTRDGSFNLNEDSELVSTAGGYVQGFAADDDGNIISGALGKISIPLGSLTQARQTERATFEGNLKADGDLATTGNVLSGEDFTTAAATTPTAGTALTDLRRPGDPAPVYTAGETITLAGRRGGRQQGELSYTVSAASTLDDLRQFFDQALAIDPAAAPPGGPTPGTTVTPSATVPGAANLTIVANAGTENALTLAGGGYRTTTGGAMAFAESAPAVGESTNTSVVAYDSLGSPVPLDVTLVLDQKTDTGTTWRFFANSAADTDSAPYVPGSPGTRVGTGTVTFDTDGKFVSSTDPSALVNRDETGAATPMQVDLDFAGMTALASDRSTMFGAQDGTAIGTLNGFTVGGDGTITGSFDNGLTRTLGQVALATFDNPQGLIDVGGNLFRTGINSGVARVTGPLELTAGALRSGALELSNVDLSAEFINLITASTGFSAASRVITTSDRLMTELLQTTR